MSRRTSPAIEVARPSPTSDPEDILESPAGGAPRSADPLADQALDFGRRALGLTHHPTLQADTQTGNARADFGRSAARQLGSSGAQLPVHVTQSRTVTGLPPTSRDGSDLFRLEFSVSTPQPQSDWGPKARWFKSSRPDSPEVSAQLCTVEHPQSRAQFARWCRAVQGSRQTQNQTQAAAGGVWVVEHGRFCRGSAWRWQPTVPRRGLRQSGSWAALVESRRSLLSALLNQLVSDIRAVPGEMRRRRAASPLGMRLAATRASSSSSSASMS